MLTLLVIVSIIALLLCGVCFVLVRLWFAADDEADRWAAQYREARHQRDKLQSRYDTLWKEFGDLALVHKQYEDRLFQVRDMVTRPVWESDPTDQSDQSDPTDPTNQSEPKELRSYG